MKIYSFRPNQSTNRPTRGAFYFPAHSLSHARLRAGLLSYVVFSSQAAPNLSSVQLDDGTDPNANCFPESYILPIEQCLFELFANASMLDTLDTASSLA
jgi:hypothetical protein